MSPDQPVRTVMSLKIFRGPRIPTDQLLSIIPTLKTVVSLETGWWEFFHGKPHEEIEEDLGLSIQLIRIPCSNFLPPKDEHVSCCARLMNWTSFYPLYIHCLHGVDRTGWMCAAFRVLIQRWTVDQAIQEWKELGFHSRWYWWWPWMFKRQMKRLS